MKGNAISTLRAVNGEFRRGEWRCAGQGRHPRHRARAFFL